MRKLTKANGTPEKTTLGTRLPWMLLWVAPPLLFTEDLFRRDHHDIKELSIAALLVAILARFAWHIRTAPRLTLPGLATCLLGSSLLTSAMLSEYSSEALFRTCLDLIMLGFAWWWVTRKNDAGHWRFMVGLIIGVTTLLALKGLLNVASPPSQRKYFEPIGHWYYWSQYLIGAIPIMALHPKTLTVSWRSLAFTAVPFLLLILLGRRMPLAALLAGAGCATMLFAWRNRKWAAEDQEREPLPGRRLAIAGAIVAVVCTGAAFLGQGQESIAARVGSTFESLTSGDMRGINTTRMPLYRYAPEAIARQPQGYGRGSYPLQFFDLNFRNVEAPWTPNEIPSYHPYNSVLHLAIEGGWLAALAVLFLYGWVLWRLLQELCRGNPREHSLGFVLLVGLIAYGIDSLTFSAIEFPLTRLLLVFYLASAVAWIYRSADPQPDRTSGATLWRFGTLGLVAMCVVGVCVYFYSNYQGERGREALQEKRYDKAFESVQTAARLNPAARTHRLRGMAILSAQGKSDAAIQFAQEYLDKHPHDALLRIEQAKVIFQRDNRERPNPPVTAGLIAGLEKALEYWPAAPDALENLGVIHERAGNPESARRVYETFFEYYPNRWDCPPNHRPRYDSIRERLDALETAKEPKSP